MNIEQDYGQQEYRARRLEKAADELLWGKGYNHAGKDWRDVVASQEAFESLAIRTPTGGKPGRRF